MKRIITTLLLSSFLIAFIPASAQYCGGSGPSVCTPGGPYATMGFYPSYFQMPCAEIGTAYSQKIDMQIPSAIVVSGISATLNWVRIDTILNLPCGLCWRTNNANNQFNGNSAGCVQVSGTTYDAPGQYKLHIIITANASVGGFPITLSNQNADTFGIKYWLRVENLDGTCDPVDTLAPSNFTSVSGTATPPVISGNTAICPGQSTTLSISSADYYAYQWSNGATTASILVNAAGTYTVTAYGGCSSATASATVTQTNVDATITANGPLTFCQGGNVMLSAPSGGSYAWSNGATTQSITVDSSATYTVTVTQNTCTATDSKTVTVTNNNLSPIITPANPQICAGGSVTLDAGSGYSSYLWNTGANSSTIQEQPSVTTTYDVTVTQGTCQGTASVTVTVGNFPVTVHLNPSGTINACTGDTVSIDAGSSYSSYSWSNSASSSVIHVTTGGIYSVTVAQQNGCTGIASATVAFQQSPQPSITPAAPIELCEGETALLDAGSGFDTYLWSNGSTTSSIVVSNSGTYMVTVTQNGCSGSSAIGAVVTVHTLPDAAISVVTDAFGDAVLHATQGAGYIYTWQYAAQDTTGTITTTSEDADSSIVNCDANAGYYRVLINNLWGCTDTSSFVYIDACTGIYPLKSVLQFQAVPNPTTDNITLSYTLNNTEDLTMSLMDMTGRIVKPIWSGIAMQGTYHHQVSLSELSSGIYFIALRSKGGALNYKIVKQ